MADFEARLAACEAFIARMQAACGGDSAPGGVASDRELDGQKGDPVVKYEAKDWRAPPSFIGKKLSQCTPEYLEFMADGDEDYANHLRRTPDSNPKKKNIGFKEQSARLCRGWAKRLRDGGWVAPAAPAAPANPFAKKPEPEQSNGGAHDDQGFDVDDEIPF